MAPEVGFEPTTNRLTADRSTTELLWNVSVGSTESRPTEENWLRGLDLNQLSGSRRIMSPVAPNV